MRNPEPGSGCICSRLSVFSLVSGFLVLSLSRAVAHLPARRLPQRVQEMHASAQKRDAHESNFTSRNVEARTSLPGAESPHASNCDDLTSLLVLPFQRKRERS